MNNSLDSELMLELRRLHAAGISFGYSEDAIIDFIESEIKLVSPSLISIAAKVEGDPGLSLSFIKFANCTIAHGVSPKSMTAKNAVLRVGLDGVKVALALYKIEMLKRVVSKRWSKYMDIYMTDALKAGASSYKVAKKISNKKEVADFALHLAMLYSLGVFAKIIAADSLNLTDSAVHLKSILSNSALAAEAVLITASAKYDLITKIEQIEHGSPVDVSVFAAKAGWACVTKEISEMTFQDVELKLEQFT